jgi:nucleotide-binding universal stress UspA family protein
VKLKKILLPTDFSPNGKSVLGLATALARDSGATLLIVHVDQPPIGYGGGDMGMLEPPQSEHDLEEMLKKVTATDPSVPCEHHLVTGDPAREIVRLAAAEGVDLIVMGTHGRGGLTRLLMGSVAEEVVRRAQCPVLSIKEPSGDGTTD